MRHHHNENKMPRGYTRLFIKQITKFNIVTTNAVSCDYDFKSFDNIV